MSTVLSSLEGLGGKKLDLLSSEAPSIVTGHTGNNDMEDEFRSECLVIRRPYSDLFILMKAKLDRLSKDPTKRIGNNKKLPLLLTFPYIRITKEMESMLRKHIVRRGSAINVSKREKNVIMRDQQGWIGRNYQRKSNYK